MKSCRDRRQCYLGIAFLIVLLFGCATARYDQLRGYIAAQHHRPWGVKQNAAKISLSNSQQQQQREVLDAYLMGIRGGSSAYYGDSGNNYYDRDGDRGGRYDRGGYEYGRKSGAMGSPAGDDDPDDPDDRKNTPVRNTCNIDMVACTETSTETSLNLHARILYVFVTGRVRGPEVATHYLISNLD